MPPLSDPTLVPIRGCILRRQVEGRPDERRPVESLSSGPCWKYCVSGVCQGDSLRDGNDVLAEDGLPRHFVFYGQCFKPLVL
jgi:hypothetical protein